MQTHAIPVRSRTDLVLALFVAGAALLLYSLTAAPWLTWANDGADGGDLITAAMTGGVPHPSGYPTYCLLGRLYALLPLGPIARRFNLFSATAGALTVALVYLAARRVLERGATHPAWLNPALALLVALACVASPTLWSQATIAEVYALNALFVALTLYIALREDWLASRWAWAALGLSLGVGLGAHLTLMLLVPGLAVLLWHSTTPRRLLALALGLALGLMVYLYLPLAARGDPPVNWGNPHTWAGFWWLVSARLYHGYAFGLPLQYLPARLGAWAGLWGEQYTWLGLALALLGLWAWSEQGRRTWAVGTVLMVSAYAVYAILYNTTDSYVYLIPSYLVTTLWLAEGVNTLLRSLLSPVRAARQQGGLLVLGLVVLAILPLWSVLRHYPTHDLSQDRSARAWVDEVTQALPTGALLITGQDRHTFTLDYVRWVEQAHRDLLVVDGDLLREPWYAAQLARRYPALRFPDPHPTLEAFIAANLGEQTIFLSSPRHELEASYQIVPDGPLWQINGPR